MILHIIIFRGGVLYAIASIGFGVNLCTIYQVKKTLKKNEQFVDVLYWKYTIYPIYILWTNLPPEMYENEIFAPFINSQQGNWALEQF